MFKLSNYSHQNSTKMPSMKVSYAIINVYENIIKLKLSKRN